jgi:Fe-S cluster assembly protein SufD
LHLVTERGVGAIVTPRVSLEVGAGAKVSVIETYGAATSGRYLALPLTEVRAHAGAVVEYVQLQQQSESALQVASLAVEQHRDAVVRSFLLSVGGAVVRNNVQVALRGSNTSAVLNGLSVLRGAQHIDNATVIHHIEPHAESREHFKGVYADQSRGVFSGTITVEREAQKTNAFQSNQAVLLSASASIESRPQLKIWADDVKCTHGATVGQLDADALFYLRSRGLAHQVARNLLLHAFASEVLTMLVPGPIRNHVEAMLSGRLNELAAVG